MKKIKEEGEMKETEDKHMSSREEEKKMITEQRKKLRMGKIVEVKKDGAKELKRMWREGERQRSRRK